MALSANAAERAADRSGHDDQCEFFAVAISGCGGPDDIQAAQAGYWVRRGGIGIGILNVVQATPMPPSQVVGGKVQPVPWP